ncbi:MAG: serine/threonine protein kinase [Actinobacteria bacterium]|nr:serine/threonine protein kinase [Actinomycetota bacterium]
MEVDGVLGDGRYRLARRLGAGGMASVWLAHDDRLDRPVAIKVISDTLAGEERYRERFDREARAAASLSHPNIVPVYDYGVHDGHPFLVMEYVPGGSLSDLLRSPTPAPLDVVELARQLLSALDCVHRAGLVHRDVKPANILLDASARARLTDFGIAQPEDATSLTQTGMIIGTLRYLAPEVVEGAPAAPAADLYAAGMVLRELTRQQPEPALASLVAALTAADPVDRPASAAAALQLLAQDAPTARQTGPTRVATIAAGTDRTLHQARPQAGERMAEGAGPPGLRRISPAAAAGTVIAIAIVVVLVIALGGGDGGSTAATKTTRTVAPAPAGAPLDEQLRALRRLVDEAAGP